MKRIVNFFGAAFLLSPVVLILGCNEESFPESETTRVIRNSVEYFVEEMQPGYALAYSDEEGGWIRRDYVPYDSAEEFLSENPDCCVVTYRGNEGYLPPMLRRIWFSYRGLVTINNYQLRLQGEGLPTEVGSAVAIPVNTGGIPIPLIGFYGD